ncbi:hypothetical protein WJX82_004051 [Trebouxia sp. C0006]
MLAFQQQQTALLMNLYSAYLRCLLPMDVSSLLAKMAWSAQQAVHPIMQDEPYVLLGCASGNVQVVSLLDSSGSLAVGAAHVSTLELQPFQVDAEEMKGQGAVRCLMTRSHADRHRMLVLHEDTGVIIWDLRYECPVVLARNETAEALAGLSHARATCACWIGSKGICFAVGYSTSDVCVWGVPPPVQQGSPMDQPLEAVLLGKLRVTPEGEAAEAVEQLTYIPGSATGCPNNLLVLGGQMLEMPPALTILPLECLSGNGGQQGHTNGDFQPHSIPWFGAVQGWALVPPEASINEYDDPAAIMVLTEGGQLMVHDLNTFQPVPLSLPFQELQAVTDVCMCTSPVQLGPAGHIVLSTKLHCVTLQRLRALKGQSLGIASAAGTASKWRWVFSGGGRPQPASPSPGNSDLYFTGHEDGRVRVWDVTSNVPGLLTTIPFDSGGPGVRLRAVTCLQVDVLAGLLVVGHKQGEARVYQFSQEQQEVSCVDLDGKRPAEHHSRQQPPGFQCILQCTHHAASISGIAIAARLKLVALADETGVLSLLELTRPSISYEQQVASQALVSLQFGHQVLPAPTDRRSSDRRSPQGKGALPDELLQARPALFLCQSDGALAILGVEGATLAGKPMWVQPKNRSQAINMVLLGADGAPLYPKDTHLHLTWPHNNMVSSIFQDDLPGASPRVKNLGAAGFGAEGEQPTSPTSQHSAWGVEQHSNVAVDAPDDTLSNKSATGPSSIGDQSESEDDDYLAAAVAAVEAKQGKGGKKGKVKHPHLRALRSKLGSISRSKDKEGSGSTHADAASPTSEQGLSSRQEVGLGQKTPSSLPDLQRTVFSHPVPVPPSTPGAESGSQEFQPPPPHGGPLAPAPPPESHPPPHAQPAPRRQYVGEPDADDEEEEEQAAAAHVLLCCDDSLRLYPAEGIRVGDRSSVKKVGLHEPIGFAAAFSGQHGPGLLDIKRSGDVGVWTLPGLEPVKVFSLSSCLGFPWSWQGEPSLLANLHRMCALAPDGHMALVGPCNEVVTLGILRGLQPPAPLRGLYDRDLSEASLAAAKAIADLQEKHEPWSGVVPNDAAVTNSTEVSGNDSPGAAGRTQAAGRAAHLGAFFTHVKDAASKVVEEGGAGMAKTLALGKRLPFGGGNPSHIPRPPPPTLQQLFARTAPQAESSGEIANITDDEDENADKPDPHFQHRPAGSPAKQNWEQRQQDPSQRSPQNAFSSLQGAVGSMFQGSSIVGGSSSGQPDSSSGREELLYGARQPESKGKGGVRSAAEIRSAYGRSSTRERDIRSTMADNMVALEDRGEKLRNLQDKTADLGDGAADFASVAKALKEQSASRKWWQL